MKYRILPGVLHLVVYSAVIRAHKNLCTNSYDPMERGINVRAFYKSQVQSVYASDFTVSAITSHSEVEPSRYLLITMAADGAAVA